MSSARGELPLLVRRLLAAPNRKKFTQTEPEVRVGIDESSTYACFNKHERGRRLRDFGTVRFQPVKRQFLRN